VVSQKRKLLSLAALIALCVSSNCSLSVQAKSDSEGCTFEEQVSNNKSYQVSHMLVKSSPAAVWQVLTDYNGAPKTFPTLKKVHVLSECGNNKRVHYQIRPTGLIATYEYDLDIKETPHKQIEFHRINGDFKEIDGFWKLEPAEGGRATIVTYGSHVNGGIFMPQALIKHQSRVDMPVALNALRGAAESTTQIAVRTSHTHGTN
jgi:ribosome-associated toxin RatA of RatAB toxin-antitoxin module